VGKLSPNIGALLFGLLLDGLILDHVPMLYQVAVFDAENVRCNPVHRCAEAGDIDSLS